MADDDEYKSEGGGESGSVWTSYSDLFMAIAVVFLIMFVFTTLKSVNNEVKNKITQKENEEYKKAIIPPKTREKNEKQMEIVKDTLLKIQEKRKFINQSVEEINNLSKLMEKRQETVSDLIKDQVDKIAMLDNAKNKIQEKDQLISDLKENLKKIQQENLKDMKVLSESITAERSEKEKILREAKDNEIDLKTVIASLEERMKPLREQKETLWQAMMDKNQQISNHNLQIKALNEKIEVLDEKLVKEQSKSQKTLTEAEKLKNNIASLNDSLNKKSDSINAKSNKISSLSEELGSLTSKIQNLQKTIDSQNSQVAEARDTIKSLKSKNSGQQANLTALQNQIKDTLGSMKGLKDQLANKDSTIGDLQNELGKARGKAEKAGIQLAKMIGKGEGMSSELSAYKKKLGHFEKYLNDAEQNRKMAEQKANACLERSKNTVVVAKDEKKNFEIAKNELIKAKKAITDFVTERKKIASNILATLQENGVDVEMDPNTGIITLRMDEAFLFKNNSYELTTTARHKLKQLLPPYAKGLFKNLNTRKRIAQVTVTGHASPRHRRKYVDPFSNNQRAFRHNLSLSVNRAQQIATFLFGDEIGSFKFKELLKSKIQVSGRGYMDPILEEEARKIRGREMASQKHEDDRHCGPYDCALSRRVEIGFILADRDAGFENIETFKDNLKTTSKKPETKFKRISKR